MTWNVTITSPAQKHFRKLQQEEQSRVKAILLSMESDPFQGDLKRLKGNLAVGVAEWATTATFTTSISRHARSQSTRSCGAQRRHTSDLSIDLALTDLRHR